MKEQILAHLPGDHPWQNHIHWFDTIDSTNTRLKVMAAQGAPHGTVLLADCQTGGRGRLGRSFQSSRGLGVYLSVLLRPRCQPGALMHLTCAAGVAMCDALEQAVGLRPRIKWTNDLVWEGRKLGGILTELVFDGSGVCAIVGIGINCCHAPDDFSPALRDMAASLSMVTGKPADRARVAAAMIAALGEMDRRLLTERDAILARYEADCMTIGNQVQLLLPDGTRREGLALGIDGAGALLVRFGDGSVEAVAAGEISVRGMYGYV